MIWPDSLLVVLPEGLLLSAGALLLSAGPGRSRWDGWRPELAWLASLLALGAVFLRAPWLDLTTVGAPLTVIVATLAALTLARGSGSPGARGCGWLLVGAALLLRLATWPGSRSAPLVLGALLVPAAALALERRASGRSSPARWAWVAVALPAALLVAVEGLVARAALPAQGVVWAGAIWLTLGHLLAARASSFGVACRWIVMAQSGALLVVAGLCAQRPETWGVLSAAIVATAVPSLGLLALAALVEHERDLTGSTTGLLTRNHGLALALTTCLASLVGLPLTLGFAVRVRALSLGAAEGHLAPLGLYALNMAALLALSLSLLRPLLFVPHPEREPWRADSSTTLVAGTAAVLVLSLELLCPGFGAGSLDGLVSASLGGGQ